MTTRALGTLSTPEPNGIKNSISHKQSNSFPQDFNAFRTGSNMLAFETQSLDNWD